MTPDPYRNAVLFVAGALLTLWVVASAFGVWLGEVMTRW